MKRASLKWEVRLLVSGHLVLMNTGGGATLVNETRIPEMGSSTARFRAPCFDGNATAVPQTSELPSPRLKCVTKR